ncbi:SH3 domain-containing protein [Roseibium aggregatum]|uniref:SH3 domain-containing protein n=1 Tax=Roseibium aggregatum TaxID=187304 RepID=A0A926P495_9HYPH|nr:SH3 domain-containing protein [Roseibium aggregatum]MBD1546602.1 SH3 domain-containing protein [Roseibium aggregatum]
MRKLFLAKLVTVLLVFSISTPGFAALTFSPITTDDGVTVILVRGTFAWEDSLSSFRQTVRSNHATVVSFASGGGNVTKAMELGREIRLLGLSTLQLRSLECASACALAFMGGVQRYAEPGAIGVHKSSFSPDAALDVDTAVSAVQELTAEIVAYMAEMGIDPRLLQVALKTEANDMRYLSGQEMEQFKLTSFGPVDEEQRGSGALPPSRAQPSSTFVKPVSPASRPIPIATSGTVRHPRGAVALKTNADKKSANVATLRNGTPLAILGSADRWYRVRANGLFGYLHHTWVRVDQFDATIGDQRLIQIKSFDNLDDALTYARALPLPLSIYLATNGWYAVTIRKSFERDKAISITRSLKNERTVPADSFVTLGNTYVMRLCCD